MRSQEVDLFGFRDDHLIKMCGKSNFQHVLLTVYRLDIWCLQQGAVKSLARPTSRCILFDG